mgnify:CR=1 FL=1|jgi:hypothetical protein
MIRGAPFFFCCGFFFFGGDESSVVVLSSSSRSSSSTSSSSPPPPPPLPPSASLSLLAFSFSHPGGSCHGTRKSPEGRLLLLPEEGDSSATHLAAIFFSLPSGCESGVAHAVTSARPPGARRMPIEARRARRRLAVAKWWITCGGKGVLKS